MKVAMRGLPNRATRNNAPAKTMPAKSVNGIPVSEPHDPATIGLKSPKTVVNRSIRAAEPNSTKRAAMARRIKISNNAPKLMAPK